ncbi:RMI1 protein, partial [Crotophaga sulcirostris]|nr:RMI1 protein [Crotophaga sulcirostris]
MSLSNIAARVETWLSSTWHVKVPLTWLEACISWIQEENSGSNLTQAEINRQVFQQWLLTDLRDLEYAILPDCILDATKGELTGFYSIQIDSLVDVSQPVYLQLQKLRGKNNINEEVTASTQAFQKPWEAKPTGMLMLQLTDGMCQIQGMEYQPVPVLHSDLPPGTKITLQGNIMYRLGVLLLKPENVKLLGGEVDTLLEEYSQERVLARLIGETENPNSVGQTGHNQIVSRPVDELEQTLAPSDKELLASLDENNEHILNNETSLESGYCSRSNNFSTATGSSFGRKIFDGDGNSMSSFSQHRSIHQACSSADFSLESLSEDKQNDTGLHENRCKSQQTSDSRLLNYDSVFFSKTNVKADEQKHDSWSFPSRAGEALLDLGSPPFTYISLLLAKKPETVTIFKAKCFIVTLTGNLTSSNGSWGLKAKISDGSAYLEVDFADHILTSLIGFSVPEMIRLKKDPALHLKLKGGLEECQKQLIDLCCLMTIEFNPLQSKATVLVLQDVDARHLEQLKKQLSK